MGLILHSDWLKMLFRCRVGTLCTLLHFSNAKSGSATLLPVANLSSNEAPPTFAGLTPYQLPLLILELFEMNKCELCHLVIALLNTLVFPKNTIISVYKVSSYKVTKLCHNLKLSQLFKI